MAAKRFLRRRSRAAAAPDSEGGARGGGRAEKGTRGEGGARGGGRAKRGMQEEGGGRGEGRETRGKGGARERRGDAWGEGRAGRGPWGSPLVLPRLPSPLPAVSLLSARRNWWAGRRREQWWEGVRSSTPARLGRRATRRQRPRLSRSPSPGPPSPRVAPGPRGAEMCSRRRAGTVTSPPPWASRDQAVGGGPGILATRGGPGAAIAGSAAAIAGSAAAIAGSAAAIAGCSLNWTSSLFHPKTPARATPNRRACALRRRAAPRM